MAHGAGMLQEHAGAGTATCADTEELAVLPGSTSAAPTTLTDFGRSHRMLVTFETPRAYRRAFAAAGQPYAAAPTSPTQPTIQQGLSICVPAAADGTRGGEEHRGAAWLAELMHLHALQLAQAHGK